MQGVVRCLRDGTAGSTSGDGGTLVIVQDSLDVLGGPAIFQRVLGDLCNAINAGRAQATRGVVVALQTPPDVLRECVAGSPLSVLDCHSDPHGWLATAEHAPAEQQLGGGGQRVTGASLQLGAADDPAALLRSMLLDESTAPSAAAATAAAVDSSRGGDTGGGSVGTCAPQPASACIAIDDLSALIGYCGEHAALGLLEALRRHPSVSCLLAGLHADLHPPETTAAAGYAASCVLRLAPCTPLEADLARADVAGPEHRPLGRLDARHKRRAGRVRVETELYAVRGPGPQGMVAWPPPRHAAVMPQMQVAPSAGGAGAHTTAMSSSNSAVAAAGPPQLPARQLPTAAAAHPPGGLAQQFAGGMKLALSERERAARTHVVLPYEHRGHGTQGGGSSAVDWRDALPRAAGGRSASAAHAPEARTPPAAATGGLDGSSIAGAAAAAAAARADGPGAAPRQTPAVPLGEVHYVRDTDSECDSFEDPDDDLDI